MFDHFFQSHRAMSGKPAALAVMTCLIPGLTPSKDTLLFNRTAAPTPVSAFPAHGSGLCVWTTLWKELLSPWVFSTFFMLLAQRGEEFQLLSLAEPLLPSDPVTSVSVSRSECGAGIQTLWHIAWAELVMRNVRSLAASVCVPVVWAAGSRAMDWVARDTQHCRIRLLLFREVWASSQHATQPASGAASSGLLTQWLSSVLLYCGRCD